MSTPKAMAVAAPPIWVLAIAVSASNMGISLLSPAVPLLRESFAASADEVQLVLTGFLIAVGLGQMVAGTLSDRFGRRPVMLVGALLFALASFGGLAAVNIEMLVVMRVLQGCGAAACFAMGRVIINDSFAGAEAGRQLSTITMVQAIVPILGFGFGGIIAQSIGWEGCIAIMAASASLTLISTFLVLEETKLDREPRIRASRVARAYVGLLANPVFMTNGICSAMTVAMFLAQTGFMPYQYARYGVDSLEFGMFFCLLSAGYMLGNNLNRRVVPHFGLERTSLFGSIVSLGGVSAALASHLIGIDTAELVTGCMVVMGVGHGFTVANSVIAAVRAAGLDSGSAMGLVGASQMLFGGLFGSLIVALGGAASFSIAMLVIVGVGLVAFICAWLSWYLHRNE